MKNYVKIDGHQLNEALQLCALVVEKRNTYPILGMVRLSYHDGLLKVTATDLDTELTITTVPLGAGLEDLTVCLPTQALANIARLADGCGVIIEPDGANARVSLDQGDLFHEVIYTLEGLGADGCPELKGTRGELIETFGNGRLGDLLRRVSWAMSFEETRYYLNGVAWQVGGPLGRRMVATDGHRMALCSYDRDDTAGTAVTRVIPNKLVGLLERLIPPDLRVYSVTNASGTSSPAIEIEGANILIRGKLVDLAGGQAYPDVDRVIPRPSDHVARFELPVDRLQGAIDRALALSVSSRSPKAIGFSRDDASGKIAVAMSAPDTGTSRVVTPCAWPEGGVPFGVNGRYLRDVLKSCGGNLRLMQVDASGPVTILDEDETMVRLLMPMRV